MNFNDQGIFGFDVSFYQDANTTPQKIDFNKMRNYGASFVISKAGQWYWEDEDFAYNWQASKDAGLGRASYFFCDDSEGGKQQAINYWKILERNGWNGEVCVADFETGSWTNWSDLYNFLVEIKLRTGLTDDKIWIYTGNPYWSAHRPTNTSTLNWFVRHPLWLAWWTQNPANVSIPAPWTELVMWQDGTPAIGKLVGVESEEIDHDKLNGGLDKLNYYFGEVQQPPNGGPMEETHVGTVVISSLNVRSGPGTSYAQKLPPSGYLKLGDKVYGQWDWNGSTGTQWFHMSRIVKTTGQEEAWDAWSSAIYGDRQDPPPPYMSVEIKQTPPPPTGEDVTIDAQITVDAQGIVKTVFLQNEEYVRKNV